NSSPRQHQPTPPASYPKRNHRHSIFNNILLRLPLHLFIFPSLLRLTRLTPFTSCVRRFTISSLTQEAKHAQNHSDHPHRSPLIPLPASLPSRPNQSHHHRHPP